MRLLTLSAVATFLFACGGGSTPEDVAKNFHEAITGQEWDKAKDLATAKGKEQVDAAKQMAESMGAMGGSKAEKAEAETVTCTEVKDDATTCTCKDKGTGKETKYELKKEGDKWLVDYNKLGAGAGDMMEGAGDVETEDNATMEDESEGEGDMEGETEGETEGEGHEE